MAVARSQRRAIVPASRSSSLYLGKAAIHEQFRSCDVDTVVRREKNQQQIAEANPPGIAMVKTNDLTYLPSVPYHLDQKSQITLGGRSNCGCHVPNHAVSTFNPRCYRLLHSTP